MVHLGFNKIRGFNNIIDAINDTYIRLEIALLKQSKIY